MIEGPTSCVEDRQKGRVKKRLVEESLAHRSLCGKFARGSVVDFRVDDRKIEAGCRAGGVQIGQTHDRRNGSNDECHGPARPAWRIRLRLGPDTGGQTTGMPRAFLPRTTVLFLASGHRSHRARRKSRYRGRDTTATGPYRQALAKRVAGNHLLERSTQVALPPAREVPTLTPSRSSEGRRSIHVGSDPRQLGYPSNTGPLAMPSDQRTERSGRAVMIDRIAVSA